MSDLIFVLLMAAFAFFGGYVCGYRACYDYMGKPRDERK